MNTERGGPPAPGPGVTAQGTFSENDMQFETRVTAITVCRNGDPLFSESATLIEIVDEAAGEFVVVRSPASMGAGKSTSPRRSGRTSETLSTSWLASAGHATEP